MKRHNGPGRRAIYPWDRWFRARNFTLVAGSDYQCATHGMMQMLRARASERGVRVSISLERDRPQVHEVEYDKIHVEVMDAATPRGKAAHARHAAKVRANRRRLA